MVIGKRMIFAAQTQRLQRLKETPRIADAGQRMQPAAAAQAFGRASLLRIVEAIEAAGLQRHVESRRRGGKPGFQIIANNRVDRSKPPQRFAQRPDRQTPAVAGAAPVENDQFDIASQPVVLQAVVAEQDIDLRVRRQQGRPRRRTLPPDADRHATAPGEQQRFIAHRFRQRIGAHRHHAIAAASVTPADDPRLPAARG